MKKCKKCGGLINTMSNTDINKDDITCSDIPKYCMCNSAKGTAKKPMTKGMKTKYKHLLFIKVQDKPKTTVWEFYNQMDLYDCLGTVKWYPKWRQYCSHFFYTSAFSEIVFSEGCHIVKQYLNMLKQMRSSRKL